MKKLFFMLLATIVLAACEKEKEKEVSTITVPNQTELSQTVYADQTTGKSGVNFTTAGAWTSSIAESATAKSTRAESPDWISIDPSSGDKAGNYKINITLGKNLTGEKRSATISILCGADKVTITVAQEATKEDGTKPEPEPSGEGILTNETTGENIKLTGMIHTIRSANVVAINFAYSYQNQNDLISMVLFNPLENGKLKAGTYNIKLFNGTGLTPVNWDCDWLKSGFYGDYGTKGTVKVEINDDIYTITMSVDSIIKGSFTGVPRYLNEEIKVESITLNKTTHTLEMGESIALEATILPENATNKNYTWTSSDTDVATISESGLVESVSAGTTTITATTEDGNKTATCAITVNAPIAVQSIKVEPETITLLKGDEHSLINVTVLPENAYNKTYTWKSSNENVATYDGKVIKANAAGTATITFTTEDASKTATCVITVEDRESFGNGTITVVDQNGKYPEAKYSLIEAKHTIASKTKVEVSLIDNNGNGIINLRFNNPLSNGRLATGRYACTYPETGVAGTVSSTATYNNIGYFRSGEIVVSAENNRYTFTLNNVVTTYSGFDVTGSYTGELTYTNEYVEVSSVQITPTTKTLTLGEYFNLTATVLPDNAFNKNITWSSSNSSVVSVDNTYRPGEIYASAVGTATITATTEDGAKTANCTVTVNPLPSTGTGTFSNNKSQSIEIKRATQMVNGKEPKEIDLRFFKDGSINADVELTLIRGNADTESLKAGTYTSISRLMADNLSVKYSGANTGSVTVAVSGQQYTITLDIAADDGTKITGTYTGTLQ